MPLMDGAERLIATLRRLGYKTAILSGGFTFMGRELQRRPRHRLSPLQRTRHRRRCGTGEVIRKSSTARKAYYLEAIAGAEGLNMDQVIAVGDGANDPADAAPGRTRHRVSSEADGAAERPSGDFDDGLDGILGNLLGVRDREAMETDS